MALFFQQLKFYKTHVLFALICLAFYSAFAYDLIRTDYVKLLMLYSALFFLFYKLVQMTKHNLTLLKWMAFAFRAVFICAIPNLSQDFYRFIWDGRLLLEGTNPYLYTVESFISTGQFPVAQAQELYEGMGQLNASHFTNYPPINQLCFAIAGIVSNQSILGAVVTMRLLIIAADFGTLYFGERLLQHLQLPKYHIYWYILNPFIIVELTGNLHFEGVMLFFLIWSLYLLYRGRWIWSAVLLAFSVSVKLIPLIFLPLLFQWFVKGSKTHQIQKPLGLLKLIGYYAVVGLTTIILFTPFFSRQFISNYAETVGLWFQNFEFNASLYYMARAIGYSFRGYNEIAIIGTYSSLLVLAVILIMAFFRKNREFKALLAAMLLGLTFYYFTATTVHPWYIATLLLLSVFTRFKYPLVWSYMIIFSYLAYANAENKENLWIIGFEYLIVYIWFIKELFWPQNSLFSSKKV